MKYIPHKQNKGHMEHVMDSAGFGLVEALIAGVILLFTMSSIGRFTQAAMSSGANQELRNRIEAQIMNNIQEIQQQDSRLTWDVIKQRNDEQLACNQSTQYTKKKLETVGSGYYVAPPNQANRAITESNAAPGVMVITYSFDAPENSVGVEKRVIELNPTFAADCLDLADNL